MKSSNTPLQFFKDDKKVTFTKILVKYDPKIDQLTSIHREIKINNLPKKIREFSQALSCKNFLKAEELLFRGVDINHQNLSGETFLSTAVEFNYAESIQFLISNGANVNIPDESGKTPLYKAAALGLTSVMQQLLEANAQIDKVNNNGFNALLLACEYNNVNCVKLLLKYGANPEVINHTDHSNPLMIAALNNCTEVLSHLISLKVNLNATDINKNTALMLATQHLSIDAISMLLKAGADVNLAEKDDITPLHFICRSSRTKAIEIVQLFLKYGANINARNKKGKTPLDWAKPFGSYDIIQLLKNTQPEDNQDLNQDVNQNVNQNVNQDLNQNMNQPAPNLIEHDTQQEQNNYIVLNGIRYQLVPCSVDE